MPDHAVSKQGGSRRIAAAGVVVAFTLVAIAHVLVPIDSAPYVLPILAAVAVAAMCAVRAWRSPRGGRLGWSFIAAGVASNAVADILYEIIELRSGEVPAVSIADPFYLAFYPLVLGGIVALLRRRGTERGRDVLIDAGTVALVAGLVIWQILIVNTGLISEGTLVERVVFAAYPLASALLVAAFVGLLLTPRRGRGPDALLGASLVAFLLADVGYTLMVNAEAYRFLALSDASYHFSYGLLAAAAVLGGSRIGRETATRTIHYSRLLVLGAAIVGPPVLAIVATTRGWSTPTPVYVVATVAVAAIVMSRMAGLVRRLEKEQLRLRKSEAHLAHEATHDALTGLPNRAYLLRTVDEQIAALISGDGRRTALIFLDLDQFKFVNDSLGHRAGDELLVTVAERVRALLRAPDFVARLGGDEFVIVAQVSGATDAVAIADRVLEGVTGPVALADGLTFARVSIGIALFDGHGDAQGLLRDADLALYRAKALGGRRVELFDGAMRAWVDERHELETGLRHAVETREGLRVVYQPRVAIGNGEVLGVEALVRWRRSDGTEVPPDAFIPVAETSGLIDELGAWVLDTACRDIMALNGNRPEATPIALAVNLSTRQLARPELVAEVAATMKATGMPPDLLTLELTETSPAEEPDVAAQMLLGLRSLGVRIEVDDFGVGYSSLAYLSSFPIDGVKIDRSFVSNLGEDRASDSVVAAVVALARALDLEVVAEGVETGRQVTELMHLGCEQAQGFHFARPLELEGLRASLRTSTTARAAANHSR